VVKGLARDCDSLVTVGDLWYCFLGEKKWKAI
jgi:hypothetical protein